MSPDESHSLGHVNLMVDTFIANANVDDLRAITRTFLATGPSIFRPAFMTVARGRLRQNNTRKSSTSIPLFTKTNDGTMVPTAHLNDVLTRARTLYGAGLGFSSLRILAAVVRATLGIQWEEDGEMADALAAIDADIGQAIQSSKEELEDNRVEDLGRARELFGELRSAVADSLADVNSWGGDIPFERASYSIEFFRV